MSDAMPLAGMRLPTGSVRPDSRAAAKADDDGGFDAALGLQDKASAGRDKAPENVTAEAAGSPAANGAEKQPTEPGEPGVGGSQAAFFARLFSIANDEQAAAGSAAGDMADLVKTLVGGDTATGKGDADARTDEEGNGHKKTDDEGAAAAGVAAILLPADARAARKADDAAARSGEAEGAASALQLGARPAGQQGKQMAQQKQGAAPDSGPAKPAAQTLAAGADAKGEIAAASTGGAAHSADGSEKGADGDADPTAALAKVKVLAVQTAPAPGLAPHAALGSLPSQTGAALASAIHEGMAAQAPATPQANAPAAQGTPQPMHSLQIQLQPEALGVVTANLRLAGDALHVDLRVHNAEAEHSLKTDSDTIVKSLRALGYDVDRITVQMATPAAPANTGNQAATAGRDQSFQQAPGNGANGQGSGNAGNGRGHEGGAAGRPAMERHEQAASPGGGLFI